MGIADDAKANAENVADQAKEALEGAISKAQELADKAQEILKDGIEKAKETANDLKDKATGAGGA
jgi:ElaB/YqjD/DUF883 family membrane-anchored ribosome-binding protein